MAKFECLEQVIAHLQNQQKVAESRVFALQMPNPSDEDRVLMSYITLQHVSKVCAELREQGIKTPDNLAYGSDKVSALIKEGSDCANPELLNYAQEIFGANQKTSKRASGG